MAIENRNVAVGTRLVATYKKVAYFCEVVETEQGVRYRLEDGREFKSPSGAGTAVVDGPACNGWRFWSVVTDTEHRQEHPVGLQGSAAPAEADAMAVEPILQEVTP